MKSELLVFAILLFLVNQLFAQNNAPVLTNVTFEQRTDGSFIVDIFYDVNDADGDAMSVTMQASDDAGATWDFRLLQVGANITSGTGKHIVWDFGAGHPQTFSDQIQIKIIADDNSPIGPLTDIDGNVYQTVKIGDQWWMAENLKVTHYRNGESIHNITDNTAWNGLTTGAYCAYNNDNGNVVTYGLLYNWYAAVDSRNIAPAGWHVPSDEEWKELEMHLGMSQSAADATGYRGTDEGGKMKEAGTIQGGDGLWYTPNTGATNESGFSALPGGYRHFNGPFVYMGYLAGYWSATEYSSSYAWHRSLYNLYSDVIRSYYNKHYGFSVRCVRD